ncbi:MAG: transposase [Bacillota bacterium]
MREVWGNGRQEVFHKDQDYKAFIDLMKEAKERYPVKLFAYCLMPNHFHMVLAPALAGDLSKWMQWLMTSHVRRYHNHYGTTGHIWQGRYKSFIIQEDDHLLTVLRYVEGNPVRASLANSAKDWPWSSHKGRINVNKNLLLDEVPFRLPENWEEYVDGFLNERELKKLRNSVSGNRLLECLHGRRKWRKKLV